MDNRKQPRSDEVRLKIRDGQLSAWAERKRENAELARLGFRQLLYTLGELRPGTDDYALATKALKLALADGKFEPIERRTLKRYKRALEAGHRVAVK